MRTIWKYPLTLEPVTLEMPAKAQIVHAEIDNKTQTPCLWALVESEEQTESRHFVIVGTGYEMPKAGKGRYIASFQHGPFVWHLWEVI